MLRRPPFVTQSGHLTFDIRHLTFDIWLVAVGLGLVLLFFWKLAFTNLILARGDTFLYFYPYWDYRARILLSGHLPLWNPYLFMGAPFLANSQVLESGS